MQTSIEIPLCEHDNELGRHELYAALDEHSLTSRTAREPIVTVLPGVRDAGRPLDTTVPAGETGVVVARLVAARHLATWPVPAAGCASVAETIRSFRDSGADLIALGAAGDLAPAKIAELGRALLDQGIATLVVPRMHRRWRMRRLGFGCDGSRSSAGALSTTRRIARAADDIARLDVVFVDDFTSAWSAFEDQVIASRRADVIDWWLTESIGQVPARVRSLRRAGDPAHQLAELSRSLDLLVIGTRGRARLRRAINGSVSRDLMSLTHCPLLVVPPSSSLIAAADATTAAATSGI